MIAPETLLQNRYLVLKQIGQGGMGAVYIATDQRFGSTVALKETFFTDAILRRAFEREARLLNRLRHPALPNVSDHFVEGEGQFLVMEYIAGEDLSEMLKEQGGAFPVKEVLGWADQLLDALDYLHTQDSPVIHRDIKPQNLKLTPRGQIILLDFGLAKGTPLQASQVTASGSVFGYSRNYAPIEQIQGTGTDPRSDLYSLAATLYHLMTGVTPPDALTRASAILNGQSDPLRPANEGHGQISTTVAQVLARALSHNAGQRPQTAAAMRKELVEAAKQTIISGQTTNAQIHGASTILEQDTQLIGTLQDGARMPTESVADARVSSPLAQNATKMGAAGKTMKGEPAAQKGINAPDSKITQVNQAGLAKRYVNGRTAGIAGAFIILVIAAIVFAMTRKPSAQPLPATTTNEAANPTANSSRADQSNVNQNPTAEGNLPGNSSETPGHTSGPATKTSKASVPSVPSKNVPTVQPTPAPAGNNTRNNANTTDNRANSNTGLTAEEIAEERRKARAMQRRAAAERQSAEREKRRLQEMRRRRLFGRP